MKPLSNGFFSGIFIFLIVLLVFQEKVLSQTSNIGGTINIYASVTALDTSNCPAKLVLNSSNGFSAGSI